jgi:hypothetical protein
MRQIKARLIVQVSPLNAAPIRLVALVDVRLYPNRVVVLRGQECPAAPSSAIPGPART